MPAHQFTPKSGSLDSSVISVFIISIASVILNAFITMKNFGLECGEPDFASNHNCLLSVLVTFVIHFEYHKFIRITFS